jgi:hypothetical protein
MDFRIYSETEPVGCSTGRVWIKPSNGQAFMRLGSVWINIANGTGTVVYQTITVLINGIDVSSIIEAGSLSITDVLTQEVNTCTFNLIDGSITAANKPIPGQEVHVFYSPTVGADPILIFAGRITDAPQSKLVQQNYLYEVNCSDYTQDLMRNQVAEIYSGMTAGDIIKAMVTDYAKTLGTFYVQDGISIDYISFNYKFPNECIQEIAELTGYDWFVDYEKNIHFFQPGTYPAPYSLTDNSATGEYYDLSISVDKSSIINKQVVRGGYQFSELFTEEQVADGVQASFNLKYSPFTPISVYVDVGGGYVAHTLGIDNIDETGKDFVINVAEKNIKNLDHAILTAGHKIKITYTYKMPVLVQAEDSGSIAAMKALEGGDGIYEGQLIVDDTIETKEAARARAQAEISQYSNPIIEGEFTTTQYGYKSGQLLLVNIPSRAINAYYLIREVTATSIGQGRFEYSVTFATRLKGLTDFLLGLFDSGRKVFERTDEILDTLKLLTGDAMAITDAAPTYSFRDPAADPYKWSADDGLTIGKGRYNCASWG